MMKVQQFYPSSGSVKYSVVIENKQQLEQYLTKLGGDAFIELENLSKYINKGVDVYYIKDPYAIEIHGEVSYIFSLDRGQLTNIFNNLRDDI